MADCSSTQSMPICASNATDLEASIYKSCGDLESNSPKQDKLDDIAEVDAALEDGSVNQTSGIDISGDFCTNDEEPNLKTFHTDAEITNTDGRLSLNQMIPDTTSCNIETNDCKNLGKSEMDDRVCKKNSDMKLGKAVTVCKESGNAECSEAVTSVGVVARERQGCCLKDTILKLKQLECNRKLEGGLDDFPSDSVVLKKEMEYRTTMHYDGAKDGDKRVEGFPCPCLNAFTFELDVQEAHPHDATRGPSEVLEIVSCTFGTDLAKPDCPFKGQANCHAQPSVFMSENSMFLPKFSAVLATEAIEADQTKLGITDRVDHQETKVDLANVFDCDEDYAWSCSSVTSEPIIFFPESKSFRDDDTRIKKTQELGLSIKSKVLGFEVLERDSGDSGTASDPCPQQMGLQQMDKQKSDKEKAAEYIIGNGSEHPHAETGLSFADSEKENNFFMEPLDELDHHCFQIKHFNDVSEPPSDGFDQQEVLQDQSKELTVSHTSSLLPEKKDQIGQVMTKNKLVDFFCEETKLNVPDEGVMYHRTAQEFFLKRDITGLGGISSCTKRYAALEDSKTSCSVDFTSQEGHRASISDRTVFSEKQVTDLLVPEVETSDLHASSFRKEGDTSEIKFMDIFEAPSFATLIEPDMQQPPNEIQPMLEKQLTRSSPSLHPERQSKEIIANISNCSPGRPLVPLKTLLDEANRESRRRMLHAQDRSLSSRATKAQVSRRTSGESTSTLITKYQKECFAAVDERVWNSPARLPMVGKRNTKTRLPWRPFICCPSLKEGAYC